MGWRTWRPSRATSRWSARRREPRPSSLRSRLLRDYRAAGIIFAGSGTSSDPLVAELRYVVDSARAAGSAVVALAPRDIDAPHIIFDNHAAAYDITDYVISLGHTQIAFVQGPQGLRTTDERLRGLPPRDGDRGLDPFFVSQGGFSYESGARAATRILNMNDRPHAIVAVNDEAAIGLLTLRQAGVRVPEDISVAGIDNTRPARFVELTTIAVPLHELGAAAAREVLEGAGRATSCCRTA